jgi:tetratricopeptide (TPR) repeat protein
MLTAGLLAGACRSSAAEPQCSPAADETALRAYAEAHKLQQRGDYHKALEILDSVAAVTPDTCKPKTTVLSLMATVYIDMSNFDEALSITGSSLAIGHKNKTITPDTEGLDHFLRAGIYCNRNNFTVAESEYNLAASSFASMGAIGTIALARVYSDVAGMYIKLGEYRNAEIALNRSLDAEQQSAVVPAEEYVLRLDSLVHLLYRRRKLTEAERSMGHLVEAYGDNPQISVHLRAHLYRDRGEVHVFAADYAGGKKDLQRCLSILNGRNTEPDGARALAVLAELDVRENNIKAAEAKFEEATARIQPIASNFPEDAVEIATVYSAFLNQHRHWAHAREKLLNAARMCDNGGIDNVTAVQCYRLLAEADRHLRNHTEEKQLRTKLNALQRGEQPDSQQQTVDVIALRAGR